MSLKKEVASNNIIYTAGNIGTAILSFVFSIIVANMLQPEQFGFFSFFLVVVGFFYIFTDPGISNVLIKFISEGIEKKDDLGVRRLIGTMFKLRLVISMALGLLMFVFSSHISSLIFHKPGSEIFVVMAAAALVFQSIFNFANTTFISFKNFMALVGVTFIERVSRIAIATILILIGMSAVGASIGFISSSMLASLIGLFLVTRYRNELGKSGSGIEKSSIISFGFWAVIGTLIASLYMIVDGIAVSILLPVSEIGFYSIACSWTNLISYLIPVSSLVMYPYFSSIVKEKAQATLQASIKYTLIVALPIAFLMSAFAPQVIDVFYHKPYAEAAVPLALLSFMAVPFAIAQILYAFFYGIGRPKVHAYVIACALSLDVALSFLLTLYLGMFGAAAAILAARVFEVAVLSFIIRFKIGTVMELGKATKPLAVSIIIYVLAVSFPVSGIVQLLAFGLVLLGVYITVMIAIGGVEKKDIFMVLRWLKVRV